jgi:plastocyanin
MAAAVVALPAAAASEGVQPSIEAENRPGGGGYAEEHAWRNGTQTIQAGSGVSISNSTAVAHGVQWVSGPAAPACSGVPSEGSTKWSGSCTFSQPGTYVFYCTVHGAAMKGTITVTAPPSTAPPTTPPTTPASTAPVSTTPEAASGGSPLAGGASGALKVATLQRGTAVRGSLALSQAAAGGRLEVRLQASSAALARAGRAHLVQVGRLLRSPLAAGTVSFRVPLDARARRALKARHRLAVTMTLVLTPAQGAAVTLRRAVTLRP